MVCLKVPKLCSREKVKVKNPAYERYPGMETFKRLAASLGLPSKRYVRAVQWAESGVLRALLHAEIDLNQILTSRLTWCSVWCLADTVLQQL